MSFRSHCEYRADDSFRRGRLFLTASKVDAALEATDSYPERAVALDAAPAVQRERLVDEVVAERGTIARALRSTA